MADPNFFQEVEHTPVPWRDYQLYNPLFYRDIRFISISILAPLENIRLILPSKRLKPYRITHRLGIISITGYQYRDCDIDPYNEVSIGMPVTIDKQTPLFTGTLRKMPEKLLSYSHQLPVTTEIAREVGAEFAGYPKFIADITFVEEDDWLKCSLAADNQTILTLSGKILPLKRLPRFRVNPITYRNGYILRSEFVVSERECGRSNRQEDVRLELGEGQIADELRKLDLGKIIGYRYCPHAQAILTPVIESLAGE